MLECRKGAEGGRLRGSHTGKLAALSHRLYCLPVLRACLCSTACWTGAPRMAWPLSGLHKNTRAVLHARTACLYCLQVQYSLLDRRPENGMAAFCAEKDIKLLPYGTVAGGFLTERYLGAKPSE